MKLRLEDLITKFGIHVEGKANQIVMICANEKAQPIGHLEK
jgi:hypothetical protein